MTCAAVVLVALSSAADQGTALRYRWTVGQEDRYRITQKTTANVSGLPDAAGQTMTIEQTMTQTMRMRVASVAADGTATVQQVFDAVQMAMTSPTATLSIDTAATDKPADPSSAAMWTVLSAMVGETVTLTLRPTGELLNVEGMTKIADKMTAALPGAFDPAIAALKTSMTDEAMKRTFSTAFAAFPERAVATGESWTNTFETAQPVVGTLSSTRTSTLSGLESAAGASMAKIAILVATKQTAEAQANPGGMTITMGDAKTDGVMLFDLTNGRLQQSTMTADLPMTMGVTGPDGQKATIQNNVHTVLTMELVAR